MMNVDQIKAIDATSDPSKLMPTTIKFMKDMREIADDGRKRRGERVTPWTAKDEERY